MAIISIDLSSLNGTSGFRLDGVGESDRSGGSVSSAGDVNGDGFDDVIIGARFADPNGISSGSSYVVFGKAAGFDAPWIYPASMAAMVSAWMGLRVVFQVDR